MDDKALIRAAREGQEHAGPFLTSIYAPMLLGYARMIAGDLGDAACEDICELAVERAVRKIDLYDPARGDFGGWIRSQLRYAALDYRRSHARVRSMDGLDPPTPEPDRAHNIPDTVAAALAEALCRLSEADQAILALREIEQIPSRTVAGLLNISDNAVRQRHSRARRRLALLIEADTQLADALKGGIL